MEGGVPYATQVWPRHGDGTEVRFGDILRTDEFGRVPVEKIAFDRNGCYVGDNCGHGKHFDNGATID